MNPRCGGSAPELIQGISPEKLKKMLAANAGEPVRPGFSEIHDNPRSRSAKSLLILIPMRLTNRWEFAGVPAVVDEIISHRQRAQIKEYQK